MAKRQAKKRKSVWTQARQAQRRREKYWAILSRDFGNNYSTRTGAGCVDLHPYNLLAAREWASIVRSEGVEYEEELILRLRALRDYYDELRELCGHLQHETRWAEWVPFTNGEEECICALHKTRNILYRRF